VEEVKKILGLSIAIVLVIGLVAGGTWAYFSDTEAVTGNSFTAGTIDLRAGSPKITITDLKPCLETKWGFVRFQNVGDNPGNVWLHFANVLNFENGIVDAEADAYWANSNYNPDKLRYDNFLECYTTIDLSVDPNPDGIKGSGAKDIILESEHWKLSELECQWIPLGELDVNEYFEVWVSFHVQDEAGNEFQSDEVQFDIEAILQQTAADPPEPEWSATCEQRVVRLENKANYAKPTSAADMVGNEYWTPVIDGTYGILSYDCRAQNFKYTFEAYGLQASTAYKLIYYADPWPGNNGRKIADFTTDSFGDIAPTSGSVDLAMDLPNPSDANTDGAKVWLVPASDYTGGQMTAWNPANYLFEMRLITYDDTNV
jgi:predicted ribosomally synthesized peptide with SipW-like signal peptide